MNSVLITGGCGFIGTHLCRYLSEQGWQVRVLDLRDPESPVKGVSYYRGDVRREEDYAKAIHQLSAVCHLAAVSSVPECEQDVLKGYSTNVTGTVVALEMARREGERRKRPIRFVLASSAAVYGSLGNSGNPLRENETLETPLSWYAAEKLAAEQAVLFFAKGKSLDPVALRFFNVYGEGQDPKSSYSGVITTFLREIQKGKSLSLHGGGKQTRDFVHVSDVVRCLKLVLETSSTPTQRIVNVGTGESVSIKKLAETLMTLTKSKITLENGPSREGDVLHSRANISGLRRWLKWSPQVKLKGGLTDLWKEVSVRKGSEDKRAA